MREITDNEVSRYQQDGVVHLPDLVSDETVTQLLAASDYRMQNPGKRGRNLTTDGLFFQDREMYLDQAEFSDFVKHSPMAELAGKAMGATRVSFYFDHLFALGPDSAKDAYYWHQDQPYWACAGEQICSIWLALTDCALDSGALEFVKGTDKGPLHLPIAFGDNSNITGEENDKRIPKGMTDAPVPAYDQERDQYEILSWEIKAGDALLFNTKIMHSSRGNHSKTQRRVAYSTRWIGDDIVLADKPGFQDPITFPESGYPIGAPLTEAKKFPVIWQRPGK